MHAWAVSSFAHALQNTPLGAASALPMACMLEAVRDRKLTPAEVDALATVTIGQLTALWRVRRACRKPLCLPPSTASPAIQSGFDWTSFV